MATRRCQIDLLLLLGMLLLAACSVAEAPAGFEPAPELKTPVSFSAPISRPNLPARAERIEAVVVNVVDGDTIDVSIKDQTFRIRYIGIDTPETVHPTQPEEPYGREASARNKELVAGKTVQLEKDVSETDRFDRLLRYVWLDESTLVNALLVEGGYAQVTTYPPDVRHVDLFLELQREARAEGRGLWGLAPEPEIVGSCHPAYPSLCIPPPPPDLDCGEIPHRRFTVLAPDPHGFDRDKDGIGCVR